MDTLQDKRVIVTGGSRGYGLGIVEALLGAGAWAHVVARGALSLEVLRAELGDRVSVTAADAADPIVIGHLLDSVRPDVVVLNAGASPLPRPLHHHTWESFSANWNVDVKMTSGVGGPAIAAGAHRAGMSEEMYLAQFGVSSTPQIVGEAVVQVLTDPQIGSHRALLLTATGLAPVDGPLAPRVG